MVVGASSPWAHALVKISPYTFSAMGIAISIGVSVLGAACLEMPNRYRILLYLIVGESLVVSLSCIAARYSTIVSDLMNISAMGSIVVKAGDILVVSLPGIGVDLFCVHWVIIATHTWVDCILLLCSVVSFPYGSDDDGKHEVPEEYKGLDLP
ncbi:hypothetical protein IFM89_007369 [Coptis chinensis]|uniref:Uncharacterized protein n=1 Tax=Coptis chinensis TaxID=261450 RepID=A0A835IN19_9MAGN|nr:hypothetical protein IFM89_007369 [Coptis chinensis]